MAASHGWMSPRSSGRGMGMRDRVGSLTGRRQGLGETGSCEGSTVAWADACPSLRWHVVEKGRRVCRAMAGTRNSGTEQEAGALQLDKRNACVSALRMHVWAALIDGR